MDVETVRVLTLDEQCPALPLIDGAGGRAVAVVWPGTGALHRTMHHLTLEPGARTLRQEHPGEAVYYIHRGGGRVADLAGGGADLLVEGSMVFVEPGTPYRLEAGPEGMVALGGPCPADPTLYRHL